VTRVLSSVGKFPIEKHMSELLHSNSTMCPCQRVRRRDSDSNSDCDSNSDRIVITTEILKIIMTVIGTYIHVHTHTHTYINKYYTYIEIDNIHTMS